MSNITLHFRSRITSGIQIATQLTCLKCILWPSSLLHNKTCDPSHCVEWINNLKLIITKHRIASLFTLSLTGSGIGVEAKHNMKSQRPDLMVIISIVFVFGAVATSLTANSEDQAKNLQAQVSQHIIR